MAVNNWVLVTPFVLSLLTAGCDGDVPPQNEAAAPSTSSTAQKNLQPTTSAVPTSAAMAAAAKGHPPPRPSGTAPTIEAGSIPTAEGGVTIEAVYTRREDLAGQTVRVRGKVVKANKGIMGTNWYHLQDGTGVPGSNDLTVTSDAIANVDDVVLITGTLATDKDFGMGYAYPVIVEHATLKTE
jgi:hypothetical protein